MIKINFTLDRTDLTGVEGKSDKTLMLEWLGAVLQKQMTGDPLLHLISDDIQQRARKAEENDGFEVSPLEFLYIQTSLVRSDFKGEHTRIFTQILNKFQIVLPPHVTPEMKVETGSR